MKDQLKEKSYCSAILEIPMLKVSVGTILQLVAPILFMSFLTMVEFLYSAGSSEDETRGLKIGASSLIVATYINFIYLMRKVIPPTPSWSIFEVAVLILAFSSILPIIESLYVQNYANTNNPFDEGNGLFIAAFVINVSFSTIIVVIVTAAIIYQHYKLKNHFHQISMSELVHNFSN